MAKARVEYEIRAQDKSKKATQSAERNITDLGSELGKFKKAVGTAFGVGAVVAFGKKVADVTGDLIKAYGQQERAELQLQAAIRNNPYMDGSAAARIEEFASELQQVTTVGDEVTLTFASMLAATGRTEDQIRDIMTVAADLSAGLGISLESAVRNLNKTFGGTTGELGELIPSLKDLTAEQLRNGDAVDMLSEQFDGLAQQMRNSTLGEIEAFKNAWGDLKESTGEILAEFFNPIVAGLRDIVEEATKARNALNLMDSVQERGGTGGTAGDISADLAALREQRSKWEEELKQVRPTGPVAERLRERIRNATQTIQILAAELRAAGQNLQASQAASGGSTGGGGSGGGTTGGGLTQAQQIFRDVLATLGEQLRENQRMNDVMQGIGESFDLYGANNKAVKDALQELVQNGFTMSGPGIQSIVDQFGQYLATPDQIIASFQETSDRFREMFKQATEEKSAPSSSPASGGSKKERMTQHEAIRELAESFKNAIGPMGIVGDILAQFADALKLLSMLAFPLLTVLLGMADVLAPVLEDLLKPLVGILRILGQVIGALLMPVLTLLTPVIELLANTFIWLYNDVLRPINNTIITMFNASYNAIVSVFNTIIVEIVAFINFILGTISNMIAVLNRTIPGFHMERPGGINPGNYTVDKRDKNAGKVGKIDINDLSDAALGDFNIQNPTAGGDAGGGGANYSQGRNITVNVQINTEVIAGDPGIRQLALMIRDEIFAAEALGI